MRAEKTDSTRAVIQVAGQEVEEIVQFEYSSDVLAVGDLCHYTVAPAPRKERRVFPIGSEVTLHLSHPQVQGGKRTLKHLGVLIEKTTESSPSAGTVVRITSADLGWHLLSNCAPLWYNLRRATYADLMDPGEKRGLMDPSFGLKGVRFDNELNRRLKLGAAVRRAAAQRVLDPVVAIQVEPGDTIYDKMVEYARRLNLLVNVSCDGYVQCFRPADREPPLYKITRRRGSPHNNVLQGSLFESAKTIWTEVECVGEQIGYEGPQDPNDPHAGKKRGQVKRADLLPFVHRLTFSDGEMYDRRLAQKQAEWKQKRGLFDSWYVRYRVPWHHQEGTWWECDTMCEVEDEELGVFGMYYVASVVYTSSRTDGEVTEVVLRRPGLLSAGGGE